MKNLILCGVLFLIISCTNTQKNSDKTSVDLSKINQMDWVLGKWESPYGQGNLYENWVKRDDSTYTAKTFVIVNKDTIFSENVSLELRNNELLYIPVVSGQNNELPVVFKFVSVNNGEITFENKEHDFPQRVIYKNPGPDSLYARVEGNDKGEFRKEEFSMSKNKSSDLQKN